MSMLTVTLKDNRHRADFIKINDNIYICVKRCRENQVRVTVCAPEDVKISRYHDNKNPKTGEYHEFGQENPKPNS